ncbi:pilus assembly protein TadG-related protein [Microbacterium sp.]|uniref:pilus assembly protein TadG-related protein n=1 Tax=Microbacterium sp. TaxID=51671 RepID=UPI0039E6E5C6
MTAREEEGSVLLLTLGYALLALALVFVCVDATSLYLAQKRVEQVADAAALAGADGFTIAVDGSAPAASLTAAGVREQAEEIVVAAGEARVVSAEAPDGLSARVTVATLWRPPILAVFVPEGVELAATATSRTAFR